MPPFTRSKAAAIADAVAVWKASPKLLFMMPCMIAKMQPWLFPKLPLILPELRKQKAPKGAKLRLDGIMVVNWITPN